MSCWSWWCVLCNICWLQRTHDTQHSGPLRKTAVTYNVEAFQVKDNTCTCWKKMSNLIQLYEISIHNCTLQLGFVFISVLACLSSGVTPTLDCSRYMSVNEWCRHAPHLPCSLWNWQSIELEMLETCLVLPANSGPPGLSQLSLPHSNDYV